MHQDSAAPRSASAGSQYNGITKISHVSCVTCASNRQMVGAGRALLLLMQRVPCLCAAALRRRLSKAPSSASAGIQYNSVTDISHETFIKCASNCQMVGAAGHYC
jgi:hypothetical protein